MSPEIQCLYARLQVVEKAIVSFEGPTTTTLSYAVALVMKQHGWLLGECLRQRSFSPDMLNAELLESAHVRYFEWLKRLGALLDTVSCFSLRFAMARAGLTS